ncbi:DNA cytosine methyltransferase [Cupriavidus gilardii]|uniref:DNA (cytosine-5-)-methyltransferase n=1 Tax=Cupriavidus gilardii TaxID=82541 RepID=A0ABY4VTH0_9BURK|nr:DNA (cytosine-5-)-methyltransferase [Cupriavidus gilardii]USE80464.1 DNA cytosine methyltransferase [Cupriavidus gilardii]UXC36334.1 DNA cytosine methyltransferase [Cupriavidus gilardii]
MSRSTPIPVVDLFAGPGGLGEGFSALDDGKAFRIIVSAEMSEPAHQTLRLRAFYRLLKREDPLALKSYYEFCNGHSDTPWDKETAAAWAEAGLEARRITLGTPEGNAELERAILDAGLGPDKPWVLIGGPPCQAYSLVGRSRNRGKAGYKPEEDHRHFLYREYLQIIQKYKPAVFVMENVKGILTSRVGDQHIFHDILEDLASPDAALGKRAKHEYAIHSLASPIAFHGDMSPDDIDAKAFVVKAEAYGIPQARHRVILLGIRKDLNAIPQQLQPADETDLEEALHGLPRLRSDLSRRSEQAAPWHRIVKQHLTELLNETKKRDELGLLRAELKKAIDGLSEDLGTGGLRLQRSKVDFTPRTPLQRWYHDSNLHVWLNSETRGHMSSDLRRYAFSAAFAKAFGHSPKGHEDFSLLSGLRPEHRNWESGKFADRFRVQLYKRPSTTITSHIAKDGHYFIFPDPSQCRSLTVREAARLQTFPDNYFFQGNRTEQFHQVGNAVPPLLAYKIAKVVAAMNLNVTPRVKVPISLVG